MMPVLFSFLVGKFTSVPVQQPIETLAKGKPTKEKK